MSETQTLRTALGNAISIEKVDRLHRFLHGISLLFSLVQLRSGFQYAKLRDSITC